MANFAYVKDGVVDDLFDQLPTNWKNISNFYTLAEDLSALKNLGWLPVIKQNVTYDHATQKLGNLIYTVSEDSVIESNEVIDYTPPSAEEQAANLASEWNVIRDRRDEMIRAVDWRYHRYHRQVRLNVTPTDDIVELDTYIQSLADVTAQSDPFNIIWPTL